MGVISWSPLAGGWLSGGYRKGRELPKSTRSDRIPGRYDMSIPGNQAKLEAAEKLAVLAEESGIELIHLAIAFVLRHRAISSAIIGPRTAEHLRSQLPAANVKLSADILDRIDEIVPPGANFATADAGYTPPSLERASLRRR
jgi:aryl-alcohol dehydrogenase-like predicted oxidoreductase